MLEFNTSFILLHLSTLLILAMGVLILNIKNKIQIHYIFLLNIACMFLWNISCIIEKYLQVIYGYSGMIFVSIAYIGSGFLPVSLFFTGLIFARSRVKFSLKYTVIFIIPIISLIILWTNEYHHLFYSKFYTLDNIRNEFGSYFVVYVLYSCILTWIGLGYLMVFSIKNSGFFSKQSLFIFLGTMVPLLTDVLFYFKMIDFSTYTTPVVFSVSILFYLFAVIKYNFPNITPIALQSIVDQISDAFIVVDESMNIVDYNKVFIDTFGNMIHVRRMNNLIDECKPLIQAGIDIKKIFDAIEQSGKSRRSFQWEDHFVFKDFDKHFIVMTIPIFSKDVYVGANILLKDITQCKKDMETIKRTQEILIQQDRLASLGQMIGGIVHNLKTPVMSIAGGMEGLKDLIKEYDDSIDDDSVMKEDHHEIAKEMLTWVEKMKPYCSYMSDVITAVKGQAVQLNSSLANERFSLDELMKRVNILMRYELNKQYCTMDVDIQAETSTEITGEINNLVQILNNLITNSIDAYEGKGGKIDLQVVKEENHIVFIVKDYGKGIPKPVQESLLKEMVTTKGKNGTGLGIYMSYSTLKGHFNGDLRFVSEEGKGATFYVSIPFHVKAKNEERVFV